MRTGFRRFGSTFFAAALGLVLLGAAECDPTPAKGKGIVGANTRGIIHYGKGDILPLSTAGQIDATLRELSDMNVTRIRLWVGNKHISDAEAASRLKSFLDLAQKYNVKAIVALIDFFGSGFTCQGMESFYSTNPDWGTVELNHSFFAGGWQGRYKEFATKVVAANAGHPALYAWEPGNELKHYEHSAEFIAFLKAITAHIKGLDPKTPISTGMISAASMGIHASDIYPQLPDVDIISAHTYNAAVNQWGQRLGLEDVEWALANGKEAIVGELGFDGTGDRSSTAKAEIQYWRDRGVKTLFWWGFLADRLLVDNGDGDINYGMDKFWHTDYDALFELFRSTNALP